jgi:Ice-binding-like/Stigma-specific protein, Stig1
MTTKNLCGHFRSRAPAPFITLAILAALPFACHSSQPESLGAAQSAVGGPTLGVAASFRVLGGSTVTNTGPTTIMGDLGVSPGLAITGFPPGLVIGGATHAGDATALQAQSDVTAAYIVLAGDPCAHDLTGQDLGGLTLTQGVYCFSSEAQLTGKLVLDAQGDPSAVFIFQIGSTLTTGSNASVGFINGGQDCHAFWQIGSSATLGTDTVFAGSILALTSITLNTGASVSGRALARNGAVTMDDNHVFSTTCVAAGSDAGADGAVEESGGGSGSGSSSSGVSDGSSSGVSDGSSSGSGSSSSGVSDGSSSGSGSTSGGSSGGDAAVDGSVTESGGGEAGGGLCCGGVLCGASCTNLSGDIANCGSCGHACASGEFCASGSCAPCSPVCGGACVDLTADNANCGSCGHACLASEVCTSSACVACPTLCGGACVDLTADNANCGSCGNACLASAVCTNGACVTCSTLCGGACTDLANDSNNCGSCGNACAPGESCGSGSCSCQ